MRTSTNYRPLIMNYIKPTAPEVLSHDEVTACYDPQNQVTYFLGGGNSRGTRSYDGYKETKERNSSGYYTGNDAERWTDD